jgi:hypothetical protein
MDLKGERQSVNVETAVVTEHPEFGKIERDIDGLGRVARIVPEDVNEKCSPKLTFIFKDALWGLGSRLEAHFADPPQECGPLIERFRRYAGSEGLTVVGEALSSRIAAYSGQTSLVAIPPDSPQAQDVAGNTFKFPHR